MARKKLSKTQKARNKAAYKAVRKEYNKVKDKAQVSYVQFKRRAVSRAKRDNTSLKEAAKKEAHTETFVSSAERSRENLIEAIKTKHKEAYDQLKNLNRNKGKYQKIQTNLEWDKGRGGYILNTGEKKYFIDVSNSPEGVDIEELADEAAEII